MYQHFLVLVLGCIHEQDTPMNNGSVFTWLNVEILDWDNIKPYQDSVIVCL